ncbi:uncharacterized protein An02g03170 [Aspergillus niger]|uniref:Contig An02c0090, genomic contig n=2 Tax=Aspergillus niger TaxID=5061 RepID=A2QCD3_ASPNC|nr:uncharacterized protein An02g03170 [Aspergillus niger]CAK47597.1 unnamed protein product [Aspergillus niger]
MCVRAQLVQPVMFYPLCTRDFMEVDACLEYLFLFLDFSDREEDNPRIFNQEKGNKSGRKRDIEKEILREENSCEYDANKKGTKNRELKRLSNAGILLVFQPFSSSVSVHASQFTDV